MTQVDVTSVETVDVVVCGPVADMQLPAQSAPDRSSASSFEAEVLAHTIDEFLQQVNAGTRGHEYDACLTLVQEEVGLGALSAKTPDEYSFLATQVGRVTGNTLEVMPSFLHRIDTVVDALMHADAHIAAEYVRRMLTGTGILDRWLPIIPDGQDSSYDTELLEKLAADFADYPRVMNAIESVMKASGLEFQEVSVEL